MNSRVVLAFGFVILCLVLPLPLASPALAQGQALLYQENFDSGQAKGWELESGWTVANGVLVGEGHRWARYTGGTWSDYHFRFRLRIIAGDVHVNCRLSDASRYYVGFYGGNSALNKQYFPDKFFIGLYPFEIKAKAE